MVSLALLLATSQVVAISPCRSLDVFAKGIEVEVESWGVINDVAIESCRRITNAMIVDTGNDSLRRISEVFLRLGFEWCSDPEMFDWARWHKSGRCADEKRVVGLMIQRSGMVHATIEAVHGCDGAGTLAVAVILTAPDGAKEDVAFRKAMQQVCPSR